MSQEPSRELRNQTRALLDRVAAGESITITVNGRPVASLQPVARRARFLSRSEFASRVLPHRADPGLRRDLDEIAGEMTDETPLR